MYQKNFDPHYLIDHYVRNYSKYVGIDLSDVKLDLNVRSPKGKIIHSFNNE
jgi:cytoskeletal protein RodZ